MKIENLKEIVISVEFQSLGLDYLILSGIFYSQIKQKGFSKFHFVNPTPPLSSDKYINKLPRMRFDQVDDNQDSYIIQFQDNKFIFNHYVKDLKSIKDIFDDFDNYFSIFKKLCKDNFKKELTVKCLFLLKSVSFHEKIGRNEISKVFKKLSLDDLGDTDNFNFTLEKNKDNFILTYDINTKTLGNNKICNFTGYTLNIDNNTDLKKKAEEIENYLDSFIKDNYGEVN